VRQRKSAIAIAFLGACGGTMSSNNNPSSGGTATGSNQSSGGATTPATAPTPIHAGTVVSNDNERNASEYQVNRKWHT
jgi:hypothetical protein